MASPDEVVGYGPNGANMMRISPSPKPIFTHLSQIACNPFKKKVFDDTHLASVRNQKRTINTIARLSPSLLAQARLAPGPASAITTALTSADDNDYTNVLADAQIYEGPDPFGDGFGGGGANASAILPGRP
jgi:hypothetical protein